jgi:Spherulation-specific family 4/Concanavalin A-like lectin/glucanases superfamily
MTQLMLIPAYFYPGTSPALWVDLHSAPAGSVIIANVSSGPGMSSDPVYVSAIAAAQSAGQRVVGYVSAPPGTSSATIQAQIDLWKLWYAVDGIMLDQVSGLVGDEAYYTALAAYIAGAPGGLVVFNCGAPPLVAYMALADVVCIEENTYAGYTTTFSNPSYAAANTAKVAHIIHDCSSALAGAAVYQSIFYSAGFIYVTDGTGVNPYSGLPSYWTTLLTLIATGASLGPVLQWFDDFESYPPGNATITAPWSNPSRTLISTAISEAGAQSLGVGQGGFAAGVTRLFPAMGDLGPQLTVDMWVYMPTGTTVNDPPVINSPVLVLKRAISGGELQFLIGGSGTYDFGAADASATKWFTGSVSLDTWHRFTWGITLAPSGGTSYLIVDGSMSTYGPADTQTNGSDSVVDQFIGIGQLVVGSPTAEAYMDNVSVYRGAFTPSSGGGAKPFAHMLPAGLVEAIPAISPIPAVVAGAALKIWSLLRENPMLKRREILRKWLSDDAGHDGYVGTPKAHRPTNRRK